MDVPAAVRDEARRLREARIKHINTKLLQLNIHIKLKKEADRYCRYAKIQKHVYNTKQQLRGPRGHRGAAAGRGAPRAAVLRPA